MEIYLSNKENRSENVYTTKKETRPHKMKFLKFRHLPITLRQVRIKNFI